MLPAFHGEKMERLAGLMSEVAEREAARWPRDEPIALHPRLQALTLEMILRAVFGLDEGERLDGPARRASPTILAYGSGPTVDAAVPPARPRRAHPVGALHAAARRGRRADLRADRGAPRATSAERDDVLSMLLDGPPRGRLADVAAGAARRADDAARRRATRPPPRSSPGRSSASPASPAVLARLVEEIDSDDGDAYLTATVQETLRRRPVLPNAAPRLVKQPVEIGGWDYPPGVCVVAERLPGPPRPGRSTPTRTRSGPSASSTSRPAPTPGSRSAAGRRRCLGASFAMLEMKLVLRAVLSRSEVRPGRRRARAEPPARITLSPGTAPPPCCVIERARPPGSEPAAVAV